jgi:hypothetical protein
MARGFILLMQIRWRSLSDGVLCPRVMSVVIAMIVMTRARKKILLAWREVVAGRRTETRGFIHG